MKTSNMSGLLLLLSESITMKQRTYYTTMKQSAILQWNRVLYYNETVSYYNETVLYYNETVLYYNETEYYTTMKQSTILQWNRVLYYNGMEYHKTQNTIIQ